MSRSCSAAYDRAYGRAAICCCNTSRRRQRRRPTNREASLATGVFVLFPFPFGSRLTEGRYPFGGRLANFGGLQIFEDLIKRHPLDTGEEVHLHSQGSEDLFLGDQAHGASHLTEFLPPSAPPQCLQDAVAVDTIEDFQAKQNVAQFLFRA